MATVKERIAQIPDALNISRRAFQKSIEVSPTYIVNMVDRPTDKVLKRIKATYPYINIDWILTGNGDMFLENPTFTNTTTYRKSKNSNEGTAKHVGDNITNDANTELLKSQSVQIDKLIALNEKKDEQIDRLITLLTSKMQGNE